MSVTYTATKEDPVAQPAYELAVRPMCEACGKWAGTVHVGTDRVLMCGSCMKLASQAYAAGLATDDYGRDAVLAAARRDT